MNNESTVNTLKGTQLGTQRGLLLLINALLFQLAWFLCVSGGDAIAVLTSTFILIVHASFFIRQRSEWLLIVAVTLVGYTLDSALFQFGFLLKELNSSNVPLWLTCLWLLFSCTLSHSLYWLHNKLWLAAILGAIAGPSSYYLGSHLSAVTLAEPLHTSLLVIALIWALLLPMLLILTRKLKCAEDLRS
jgi:hypothetical protein